MNTASSLKHSFLSAGLCAECAHRCAAFPVLCAALARRVQCHFCSSSLEDVLLFTQMEVKPKKSGSNNPNGRNKVIPLGQVVLITDVDQRAAVFKATRKWRRDYAASAGPIAVRDLQPKNKADFNKRRQAASKEQRQSLTHQRRLRKCLATRIMLITSTC